MFKLSILINESDILIISCSGNILLFVVYIAHEAMVAYAGSITPKSSEFKELPAGNENFTYLLLCYASRAGTSIK